MMKAFKIQLFDLYETQDNDYQPKKVRPIPYMRLNTSGSAKIRKNLAKHGNKYYSKLVASGEDVTQTLKNIKKLKSLKHIGFFEFDAILADESGIKELYDVREKVKKVAEKMILRIRRAAPSDKKFLGEFCKTTFKRTTDLLLDFPGTPDLDDKDMVRIGKALKNTPIIKFGANFVNLPNATDDGLSSIFIPVVKLRRLEELKIVSFIKKTKSMEHENFEDNCGGDECSGILARLNKLKKFSFSTSTYTGWTAMSIEVDPFLEFMFASIITTSQLEVLELKFGNEQLSPEIIMALSKSILALRNLKVFSIEFLNTKISDFEIALLGQEMAKFKHLERITFKVIQNPCASEACVAQFVSNVLELDNLKMFDLYFRRMNISDEGISNLKEHFSAKSELECQVSKRSFYAFRRPYHIQHRLNLAKLAIGPKSNFVAYQCGAKQDTY